ncbi:MAG: acetamidase/formamidase family protein, partial [Chloroflexota bacterium]
VTGAEPGDTLVVEIMDIQLDEVGTLRVVPGKGIFAEGMQAPYGRLVHIKEGMAIFSPGISFPVRPMVGVIATSPAAGELTTNLSGEVGGNLDHNDITVGAKVYLPVFVPGALFGLGDLHASMGDGEVTCNGIEIGGCTTVRLDLIKGRRWSRPWLENVASWITSATGANLAEAIRLAVADMIDLLVERLSVNREDAYMLISARGDVRIGQSCAGGNRPTVRVVFGKLTPETR